MQFLRLSSQACLRIPRGPRHMSSTVTTHPSLTPVSTQGTYDAHPLAVVPIWPVGLHSCTSSDRSLFAGHQGRRPPLCLWLHPARPLYDADRPGRNRRADRTGPRQPQSGRRSQRERHRPCRQDHRACHANLGDVTWFELCRCFWKTWATLSPWMASMPSSLEITNPHGRRSR